MNYFFLKKEQADKLQDYIDGAFANGRMLPHWTIDLRALPHEDGYLVDAEIEHVLIRKGFGNYKDAIAEIGVVFAEIAIIDTEVKSKNISHG